MSLLLYFDEDAAEQVLILALRSRGIQVGSPHEVGLLGADDLVQLRWCTDRGYTLVSHNVSDFCRYHRDFLARGECHWGLILVKQQAFSIGERLRRLIRIAHSFSPKAMQNRVEFLGQWGHNSKV